MNNLDLVWSSRCCPGCSLHDHWHQGASLATRRSEGGSQGSYLGQECHEFCELHIQSFMPYECWVAMPKNENEKWVTDNQCLFPNRDTFCPIFTPIRHFFWLSLAFWGGVWEEITKKSTHWKWKQWKPEKVTNWCKNGAKVRFDRP